MLSNYLLLNVLLFSFGLLELLSKFGIEPYKIYNSSFCFFFVFFFSFSFKHVYKSTIEAVIHYISQFVGASMGTSNLKIPAQSTSNDGRSHNSPPSRACCVVVEYVAGRDTKELFDQE